MEENKNNLNGPQKKNNNKKYLKESLTIDIISD